MPKSATEVMQEIVFAAILDGIDALKAASRGVPNALLRDLGAIHANTALADLPKELQTAIEQNVRGALTRLQREGYAISPGSASAPQRPRLPAGPGGLPPRRGPGGPGGRMPPRRPK